MSRLDSPGRRARTPVALPVVAALLTPFTGASGTASLGEVLRAIRCPWWNAAVAPRPARRPTGRARRPRVSGIFEGGATQPGGMQRRPNAGGLPPRHQARVTD